MKSRLKICTVVGTRPEIIRLSQVINKITQCFDQILVNTNQNSDTQLNKIFFKELKITQPKYNLKLKGNSSIEKIASILENIEVIIKKEKPDGFLVLGDTNSALSAYVAKRYKVPIFHMEAGNRCFDLRVPEEINREIVDKLADINITYSQHAKENLIREGFDLDKIIISGSPLYEVYLSYKKEIENSKILKKIKLKKNNYILLSVHREENIENLKNLKIIFETINKISLKKNKVVIVTLHPRTKQKIKKINFKLNKKIKFYKPFGYFDYAKLQQDSELVISDSGSITEEAQILSLNAINIRETHERMEGMDCGTVIMSNLSEKNIISSVNLALNKDILTKRKTSYYFNTDVSNQICKILQSYIEYVNKRIWYKES